MSECCVNRKAAYDYFLKERFECGIVLVGPEVKSVYLHQCNIADSFVRIENNEAFVYGFHISPYENGNIWNIDADRPKKLLLHKSEIRKLEEAFGKDGQALIPTKVYFANGKAKIEVAIAVGKHNYDKRKAIAKRDATRDIERAFAERSRN